MKPITYKPNPDCEGGMEVHRYGKYVSEAEYNELKKQVERLTNAGDAMLKAIKVTDPILDWKIELWNAAKEGKQP